MDYAEEIRARIRTQWVGRNVRYIKIVDSTNRAAWKMGEEGAVDGTLVITDQQTAGRGRSGRDWSTPPGTDIAMSLLLRPRLAPERTAMVTPVMGMAVTKAVRELFSLPAGIKWPNDVVLDGRKLSGTLTEMNAGSQQVRYIVVGTGINVNTQAFPESIADRAVSLRTVLGREISRADVTLRTLEWFEKYYMMFLEAGDLSPLREEYEQMLLNTGRSVRVLDPKGAFTGICSGVDVEGNLLVEREDGVTQHVRSGEVSVRGIYGYV